MSGSRGRQSFPDAGSLSKQLAKVFDKADDDDHCGACQADEKQRGKDMHPDAGEFDHAFIVNLESGCNAAMLDSGWMAVLTEKQTQGALPRSGMPKFSSIALGFLSAFLLNLPFPIAGPLPPWRASFGWIALVPLLYALLAGGDAYGPRYLRRSAITGYLCGILWYILNCYWIDRTMNLYGHVPQLGAAGILVLYSLVLGLYFGLFALIITFLRRASGGVVLPLALAPFVWVGIELAASRITSVPWDQFGYSQVDNFWLTRLAPWTGVYGISFVLVAVNALLAAALLAKSPSLRLRMGVGGVFVAALLQLGSWMQPDAAPTQATAVLLQENFDVNTDNYWLGPVWDSNIGRFLSQSESLHAPWYEGMPSPSKPLHGNPNPEAKPAISLIAWPEAPSPFTEGDPRFQAAMRTLAGQTHAAIVVGNPTAEVGVDAAGNRIQRDYNSASFISPEGEIVGRYNKIHLVPFGEYVPYRDLFFFAHHLTNQVGDFSRGTTRNVFRANGHAYGVFICYESIFADEIRHFAKNGADVFVNISDDGWYGDTSAPWQHLNMARMRAIENRRWILRDTNSGVTASIDPYGRVLRSSPRHVFTSLAVPYGFRNDLTFYTLHGDVFAYACGIIVLGAIVFAGRSRRRFQQ
jgi:apolipoprotein N-acyltransferase